MLEKNVSYFYCFTVLCLLVALQLLVHTAVACAFLAGLTSDVSVPRDHPFLAGIVSAMVS